MFLLLVSLCLADQRWVAADVEAVRWPDVTTVSLKLKKGDEVETLLKDGERVRVRKGFDFGWVPATSLTEAAPVAAPADAPADAPLDFTFPTEDFSVPAGDDGASPG